MGTTVFVAMLLRFSKANVKRIAVVFFVVVVLHGIKRIRHPALTQNSTHKDKRILEEGSALKKISWLLELTKEKKNEAPCAEEAQGLSGGLVDLNL